MLIYLSFIQGVVKILHTKYLTADFIMNVLMSVTQHIEAQGIGSISFAFRFHHFVALRTEMPKFGIFLYVTNTVRVQEC